MNEEKELPCFEQQIFDRVISRQIHVTLHQYKINKGTPREETIYQFIDDRPLYAYCHWMKMYHDGWCDMELLRKLISTDGASKYYDESDLTISPAYGARLKEVEHLSPMLPQELKDDVNDAARKKDAHKLIDKYFGSKAASQLIGASTARQAV